MDENAVLYVALSLVLLCITTYLLGSEGRRLSHIPTVGGSSLPLLSYVGAFRTLLYSKDVLQEGYSKYKGGVFKIAELNCWIVLVTGSELVEELRKVPDSILSFPVALQELIQEEYTLGRGLASSIYHIPLLITRVTRHLAELFPNIHDEIVTAFNDELSLTKEGMILSMDAGPSEQDVDGSGLSSDQSSVRWVATMYVFPFDLLRKIMLNSMLLCRPFHDFDQPGRNRDFCELNKSFTIDLMVGATIVRMFPEFLRPLATRLLLSVSKSVARGHELLDPILNERLRLAKELGDDWIDKPKDLLQWLIDARPSDVPLTTVPLRVLILNVAAIHTSSMTLTLALYYLAVHPEYVKVLRDEVETVARTHEWTKDAVDRLDKMDSFLKELMRFEGLSTRSMIRTALKDHTLSNGTFIPAGTRLMTTARAIHHDENIYADPDVFNPWRFSNMRNAGETAKFVNTSSEYLAFAYGRHACPGRFFASTELKEVLSHLVVNYEMKMEKEAVVPPSSFVGYSLIPDLKANVMFRRRGRNAN
ncbi:uncharacterized protein FIBRA_09244 [Fibroporia radiculosa]|uniref:Cytochrome P450 n=1 Tax=Fibroporia radiculosa TaxID=599839 RepID=J7RH83_9APHY|nr:uncharacterized protein FIBRA_09244 [Fibroporia radiculosa]CCM06932.1 predicted protein [Fibroporia radiculosa]